MKKSILLVLVLALLIVGCSAQQKSLDTTKALMSSKQNRNVLIIFVYSTNCIHCENVYPLMVNLSKKYNVLFCNIEKEDCREIIDRFDVQYVPTVIVIQGNQTIKLVGELQIRKQLLMLLNSITSY